MAIYKTLAGRPLQHFYSIEIVEENGGQTVYFLSTIHVNKRVKLDPTYSLDFTHEEILRDRYILQTIAKKYRKVTIPDSEPPF